MNDSHTFMFAQSIHRTDHLCNNLIGISMLFFCLLSSYLVSLTPFLLLSRRVALVSGKHHSESLSCTVNSRFSPSLMLERMGFSISYCTSRSLISLFLERDSDSWLPPAEIEEFICTMRNQVAIFAMIVVCYEIYFPLDETIEEQKNLLCWIWVYDLLRIYDEVCPPESLWRNRTVEEAVCISSVHIDDLNAGFLMSVSCSWKDGEH